MLTRNRGFWSQEAAAKGEGLDIAALIDNASEIFAYPMVDRDPVEKWSFGRVILAVGESVIKCPYPLSVLKDTYEHSCY